MRDRARLEIHYTRKPKLKPSVTEITTTEMIASNHKDQKAKPKATPKAQGKATPQGKCPTNSAGIPMSKHQLRAIVVEAQRRDEGCLVRRFVHQLLWSGELASILLDIKKDVGQLFPLSAAMSFAEDWVDRRRVLVLLTWCRSGEMVSLLDANMHRKD
jgi:hypothetical protein